MNIILINHYAGSPESGMEYRPYYMAREWKNAGHKVLIVSASYHHMRSRQLSQRGYCTIEGIDHLIIKTPGYRGNGVKRVLNMICFVVRVWMRAGQISKKIKGDVVIASSTYPWDIYPARKIARKSDAQLVFEVHDLWPLSPMLLGGYSRNHPFIRLLQMGEDYACRHADKIISILPATKEHFVSRGMLPEKWHYVPNGIDIGGDFLDPSREMLQKLDEIRKGFDHIAIYAGSHGIANSLDTIVDAAPMLERDRIALVLIGQGPEKERLEGKVKEMEAGNIFFLPPVPKNNVHNILKLADILLIAWNRSELYRYGISPNKIFDYMLAGKPVVHAVDTPVDPVREARCGLSIAPEDPELFARSLRKILSMGREEREEMGKRGIAYVENNHSYPILAKKFLQYISA